MPGDVALCHPREVDGWLREEAKDRLLMLLLAQRGVVARIVTGPHDANRQDPHRPMRYDTGRPRAVPDDGTLTPYFHWRRPNCFTNVIVRSRAGDRGPWPETFAVLAGGTTTVKLDKRRYKVGLVVPLAEMSRLSLHPHVFHGDWNYELRPRPT